MVAHCILISIFLVANDNETESLFLNFLLCAYFLWESVSSLLPILFCIGLSPFCLFYHTSSLFSLDGSPCQIFALELSSPTLWFATVLHNVSFAEHKFLILIKSNISYFPIMACAIMCSI